MRVGVAAFALVEDDKLDVRNIRHQAGFCFADDPGDPGFRPGILNSADDGQCMTRIANVRQADNADTFGRRLFEHL
jgi:hypothetical protein